ncbi:MAG: alpha/beta hydrolase fold domain-containing protein [Fusicatenibacter sp.]|nr:alpha/beta hydrolase fold domain-containing protein [Lachnospiraceae bacterium]MDY2937374.1 alpha/beta hydrolase fold domain-containing protein [Fusicatenibacter sp.]
MHPSGRTVCLSPAANEQDAVTPAYRLSWKAPYPAALEDCYAALKFLADHSDELGVNSNQIMVGGESVCGGTLFR